MRATPIACGSITELVARLVELASALGALAESAIILTAQGVNFGQPEGLATETRLATTRRVKRFLIMGQAILRLG